MTSQLKLSPVAYCDKVPTEASVLLHLTMTAITMTIKDSVVAHIFLNALEHNNLSAQVIA